MNIVWAGLACFKIEGESATIVIDPYGHETGMKLPKLKAHAVLASSSASAHSAVNQVEGIDGAPLIIRGAGEYEIRDALIYGIDATSAKHDPSVLYRLQIDGVTFVHLGALNHKPEESVLEHLDKTDIVFVPIGGGKYIDSETAVPLIHTIEPRLVIPMLYKTPGSKIHLEGLEGFLKELGVRANDPVPKLKILKKDLPTDTMEVAVLEPL